MRWTWNALPWAEIERPMMITLTYPADWRTWCPDGATLKRHLRAFREGGDAGGDNPGECGS